MLTTETYQLNRPRAIAHIDLDAFYVAVEVQRDKAALAGKPVVVVQYNPGEIVPGQPPLPPDAPRVFPDSKGSIIAVSYEARAKGVKRNMNAAVARGLCPELVVVQVPTKHGKADLGIYRQAGAKVAAILSRGGVCERASIDEAYVDVTEEAARRLKAAGAALPIPATFDGFHVAGTPTRPAVAAVHAHEGVSGEGVSASASTAGSLASEGGSRGVLAWWQRPSAEWQPNEQLLASAAVIVAELRAAVKRELGYTCSGGISHYKLLAKLGSGLNKPNQQTLVPAPAVPMLLKDLPIPRLRSLGGKFGEEVMHRLNISTVGELAAVPLPRLSTLFGDSGLSLARLAHGMDDLTVAPRMQHKSLSSGKTFRGRQALRTFDEVGFWLLQLGEEVAERLEAEMVEHPPQLLTVSLNGESAGEPMQGSRSCPLQGGRSSLEAAELGSAALAVAKKFLADRPDWRVMMLFMSVSKFATESPAATAPISKYFKPAIATSQLAAAGASLSSAGAAAKRPATAPAASGGRGHAAKRPGWFTHKPLGTATTAPNAAAGAAGSQQGQRTQSAGALVDGAVSAAAYSASTAHQHAGTAIIAPVVHTAHATCSVPAAAFFAPSQSTAAEQQVGRTIAAEQAAEASGSFHGFHTSARCDDGLSDVDSHAADGWEESDAPADDEDEFINLCEDEGEAGWPASAFDQGGWQAPGHSYQPELQQPGHNSDRHHQLANSSVPLPGAAASGSGGSGMLPDSNSHAAAQRAGPAASALPDAAMPLVDSGSITGSQASGSVLSLREWMPRTGSQVGSQLGSQLHSTASVQQLQQQPTRALTASSVAAQLHVTHSVPHIPQVPAVELENQLAAVGDSDALPCASGSLQVQVHQQQSQQPQQQLLLAQEHASHPLPPHALQPPPPVISKHALQPHAQQSSSGKPCGHLLQQPARLSGQRQSQQQSWVDLEAIDEAVLAELPEDIQKEMRAAARNRVLAQKRPSPTVSAPPKQSKGSTRSSASTQSQQKGISHYFGGSGS